MEEYKSYPNVMTSLGLFANPTHLAFEKQSLSGFGSKNARMTDGVGTLEGEALKRRGRWT